MEMRIYLKKTTKRKKTSTLIMVLLKKFLPSKTVRVRELQWNFVEGVFASPTQLVRTRTSDYEMIRNLISSPIFDASVPLTFFLGPSHVALQMPPDLIVVLVSLGESTFKFLDETQKVQPSKKAAAKELFEKAIVEEPFAKADEKVPSEEKAPFPQEKYTQSILSSGKGSEKVVG